MRKNRLTIKWFFPPVQWRFPVIVLAGVFTALGANAVYVSNAISYMSDSPQPA